MESGNGNWRLWPVHAFVDGLVEGGVKSAVISPGSRNTPLTLAFAEHPQIQTYTHMDERSAAFFALGIAKSTGKPVVIVCTSGTATANYYPAVMEAFEARVPLIVLTADRPPQLRDVGANQAVRQAGMYANHVKWSVEMPVPNDSTDLAVHAAAAAARVTAVCTSHPAGPVHVNYPFEEPLMLPSRQALTDTHRVVVPHVYAHTLPQPAEAAIQSLEQAMESATRPMIIIGPHTDVSLGRAILSFAARQHIPVLPDVLSQVRSLDPALTPDPRMNLYDLLLSAHDHESLLPDFVLRFGAEPTSKSLSMMMHRIQGKARVFLHDDSASYRDASFIATDVILGDMTSWLESTAGSERPAWLNFMSNWSSKHQTVLDVVENYLDQHWFEGAALQAAVSDIAPYSQIMVGNSRPVRDIDALVHRLGPSSVMYANRGVSGIDGIVSTAFGIAAGGEVPTLLCIGDVSFYHDLNGLLAANQFGLSLTVLVVNNRGGGIFQHLKQADREETLPYFTTPHELVFEPIVKAYGGRYMLATDASTLVEAVQTGMRQSGLDVIEVQFENHASAQNFRQLRELIRLALEVSAT